MEYRVEELAATAGVRVDTVRFYQSRGLLPAPVRVGRIAVYRAEHLERLREIRDLKHQGFTLDQIRRLLAQRAQPEQAAAAPSPSPLPSASLPSGSPLPSASLLGALLEERVGQRTLSRVELAAEAGVPEVMIQAAVAAGLVEPLTVEGEERFSESDLEMARAGLALLQAGFPLQQMLDHAMRHARNVQQVCDAAIELFDAHVRKGGPAAGDAAAITEAFRRLLPLVTRLVAVHFQRTLVTRALNRLEGKEETDALAAALAATEAARLDVEVSWR